MSEIEPTFLSQVDMLEAVLCAAAGGICYDCVKHGGDGKQDELTRYPGCVGRGKKTESGKMRQSLVNADGKHRGDNKSHKRGAEAVCRTEKSAYKNIIKLRINNQHKGDERRACAHERVIGIGRHRGHKAQTYHRKYRSEQHRDKLEE